jgi:hypothetical protein
VTGAQCVLWRKDNQAGVVEQVSGRGAQPVG